MLKKKELVEFVSHDADISLEAANRAFDAFIDNIKKEIVQGGTVKLIGFGIFEPSQRTARKGRNPYSGDLIAIDSKVTVKFRPTKYFREALNGKSIS